MFATAYGLQNYRMHQSVDSQIDVRPNDRIDRNSVARRLAVGDIGEGVAEKILTRLYRSVLNRNPDPVGFKINLDFLVDRGDWDAVEDLMRTFVNCSEARQMRGEIVEIVQPEPSYMSWDDIDEASDAWMSASGAPGSPYDRFRGKYLPLPDGFVSGLDPFSPEYAVQQDRLWRLMIGSENDYDPKIAELTLDDLSGPIAHTGLHSSSHNVAADHLIALGHLIKHSNIRPGDRVLEYGAGRGDIAVSFARLGAEVHTIDIDPNFCAFIKRLARFYDISLTPHQAEFGENPAGGTYKLIYFYEAFHHARNFVKLIDSFKDNLAAGGKILMAGEPIHPKDAYLWPFSCPYPWGIRLEAEVAAIVRKRGWYELGFAQEFLAAAFARQGFSHRVHASNISNYAVVHEFWRD